MLGTRGSTGTFRLAIIPASLLLPWKRPASLWLSGTIAETEPTPTNLPLRSAHPSTGGQKMETRCERRGQLEVGIVDHDGHAFAAFGSSVNGHNVTAYTRLRNGRDCPDTVGWQHDACLSQPGRPPVLGWLHRPYVQADKRALSSSATPWATTGCSFVGNS